MPLRNVRGYALALTTARYYTPSGRSIQRDYDSTALEDYVAPRDRKGCEEGGGEVKLTDAGRKVFGGDGITPDYCVEAPTPEKFVASLISRQAFLGFSRRYEASETAGSPSIAGTGSRSDTASAGVKRIGRDFRVDDAVLEDFKAYLTAQKISFTDPELAGSRDTVTRLITEVVLTQVFGEGESKRRSVAWDPQVQKALALVGRAEFLLKDPQGFIAGRDGEDKVASSARP
jgi:carboxyl-terminal processing protease